MQFVPLFPLHGIIKKFLLVPNEEVRVVASFGARNAFAKISPMLQRKPHTPWVSSPSAQRSLAANES